MRFSFIYLNYFAQFFKARLAYKFDFFSGILASMLASLGGIIFVLLLIDGKAVPSLRGWTRDQVLFIYGYSLLATALFGIVSPNLYRFGERYIIEGQFDRVLLRPLNSLFQVLFESFNLEAIGNLCLGIALVVYGAHRLDFAFGPLDVAWLLVSAVCGAVILLGVFTVLCSISFHFEDRLGLVPPMYNLMTFSRYPLPIFNRVLIAILSFVIPFGFVSFYPASHFFGLEEYRTLCYFTPVVAAIVSLVAWRAWAFGVSRYASTGS